MAPAAALFLLLSSARSLAESPFRLSASRARFEGAPAVRIDFSIPPEHKLYSGFSVADPAGNPLPPLSVAEPTPPGFDDPEPIYPDSFSAFFSPPPSDSVVVSYQGCKNTLCFLPEQVELPLAPLPETPAPEAPAPEAPSAPSGSWLDLLSARGEPARLSGFHDVPAFLSFLSPSPPQNPAPASPWRRFLDDPADFYLRRGFLPTVLLILLGGFLLNLTPCVLPMIPVNLAIIGAGASGSSRAARFGLGLAYGLGMALVYGALGLAVVLSGSVFGAVNSSPAFNAAVAILFFALALAMFDVWQLDFSRFRRPGSRAGRARLPAAVAMGGLSALLAGACVAPVLVAVLALSGALYAKGVPSALALPFLLGVGMALPWPLAAAGLAVLPKPGAWMLKVKKAFGALILLLAAYYAWIAAAPLLPRAPVAPETASPAADVPSPFRQFDFNAESPEAFEALVRDAAASGKPILFDFGANWCKVCKVMQATTLRDPKVLDALRGVYAVHVVADHPNRPPANAFLRPLAVQGFPAYLLYPAPPPEP